METLLETLPGFVGIVLLDAALIVLMVLHHRERKDMLDRLMAKNLPEYKDNTQPEENQLDEDDDKTVPLEDAEEEFVDAFDEEDDGQEK